MCFTMWFTGMYSSGKTTLANLVYHTLKELDQKVEILDSDNIRSVLGHRIGFNKIDRDSHITYLGLLSYFLNRHGISSIVAAISPYEAPRKMNRNLISKLNPYIEVYCKCSLEELIKRDRTGLYNSAIAGEIPNFTGISDPYEEPQEPEIILNTDFNSLEYCHSQIIHYLKSKNLLKKEIWQKEVHSKEK